MLGWGAGGTNNQETYFKAILANQNKCTVSMMTKMSNIIKFFKKFNVESLYDPVIQLLDGHPKS